MVPQYIKIWPILDLFLEAEQNPVLQNFKSWCDQEGLDSLGIQEAAEEEVEGYIIFIWFYCYTYFFGEFILA